MLPADGNMGVSMEQDIAGLERRQVLLVEDMTVGGEDALPAHRQEKVICHDREGENHLVDLGLAVAADTVDLIPVFVQEGDDLLRGIFVRQVVARAVVEKVPEKKHAVSLLTVIGGEHPAAVKGGSMDIRCNEPFHSGVLLQGKLFARGERVGRSPLALIRSNRMNGKKL